MPTTIDRSKERAARLDVEGIDFGAFTRRPLSAEGLRCLRYMHDIEHHTVCYLRDLLLTPAHRDPDVTAFLSCWAYEELFHGEAIARVLEAHGETAGAPRIAALRQRPRWHDLKEVGTHLLGSAVVGEPFVAVHMAWGAVNEWTTQAGYARLAGREEHPVLAELLRRIMRQEGRHVDYYASEARRRLEGDPRAQRLTRWTLSHVWRPVGSGVMPKGEVAFLVRYLFGGDEGGTMVDRIDRRVDRLPGQEGLGLLSGAVRRLSATSVVERPPGFGHFSHFRHPHRGLPPEKG